MIRIVRVHAFELNWLQQTLLRSVRRGAETEVSIKLVHRWEGDLTRPARESILRARDGENSLIQYGILLSVMETDLLIGGPSFCAHYYCSMY